MAPDDFYRVLNDVNAATTYKDLFATTVVDKDAKLYELKRMYRKLAAQVHPDKVDAWNKAVATDAFNRLTDLYNQSVNAVNSGGSGNAQPVVFATSVATHTLGSQLDEWSDLAACFVAQSAYTSGTQKSFVKIASTPVDNDLIGAEANAIDRLFNGGDPARTMYYPQLVDTFGAELDGKRVRANAFQYLEGFVNLEQVKRARPGGLDPLDAAWMWRRLLWALDYAHGRGIVHGAVLPQNVMILPAQHGLVLTDWAYSVRKRAGTYPALTAIVGAQRDWYPGSVLAKKNAEPRVDITMAARSFTYLTGGNLATGDLPGTVPAKMRAYFTELGAKGAGTVPDAALRFEDLLQELGRPYYPRAFRPFVL